MSDQQDGLMTSHTPEIEKASPVTAPMRQPIIGPIAANIAFVMELTLVPLLLPGIQLQFSLSIGDLAWIFNSYGIAVAVGLLIGGWCGDAFDPRKVFGYGVAFFAAGSLLVAAAPDYETLIIGRVIQGLGAGIFAPLLPLLLTRSAPLNPGRMLIFWGSIAGYVAAFAPLLYGRFFDEQSWNLAFIFIAVLAIVALMILKGSQVSDDCVARSGPPIDYLELFRVPRLWITLVYVFCTYGSITYYLFRLPVWLSDNEINAASVGLAMTVMWLIFSGLSTLLRNLVDSPNIRTIMLAAPLLIALGLPLSYDSDNLSFLLLSSAVVGSGLACSNAPSTQLILQFAPKGMTAVSTSLDITFARLGGIATVAIFAEAEIASAVSATCFLCLIAALCALMASKGLRDGACNLDRP